MSQICWTIPTTRTHILLSRLMTPGLALGQRTLWRAVHRPRFAQGGVAGRSLVVLLFVVHLCSITFFGAAYTWTGLYVGGQIGYGFGDNTGNVAFTTPGGMSGASPLVGDASGVIGGAHLGYNLQIDPWVIGVEGTVDGANLSKLPLIAFTGRLSLPGYNPVT